MARGKPLGRQLSAWRGRPQHYQAALVLRARRPFARLPLPAPAPERFPARPRSFLIKRVVGRRAVAIRVVTPALLAAEQRGGRGGFAAQQAQPRFCVCAKARPQPSIGRRTARERLGLGPGGRRRVPNQRGLPGPGVGVQEACGRLADRESMRTDSDNPHNNPHNPNNVQKTRASQRKARLETTPTPLQRGSGAFSAGYARPEHPPAPPARARRARCPRALARGRRVAA